MLLSVLDLGNGVSSPVTEGQSTIFNPAWSPDSQDLAYEAGADQRQLVRQRVGSQTRERLFESKDTWKLLDDWSPDGQFLLFHLFKPASLFVAKIGDSGDARLLLTAPVDVQGAHFSPDGKWVAYHVAESGTQQVWVASFPAFDHRRRISSAGGVQPVWARNGTELFYLTPTGTLTRVSVRSEHGRRDRVQGTHRLVPVTRVRTAPYLQPIRRLERRPAISVHPSPPIVERSTADHGRRELGYGAEEVEESDCRHAMAQARAAKPSTGRATGSGLGAGATSGFWARRRPGAVREGPEG